MFGQLKRHLFDRVVLWARRRQGRDPDPLVLQKRRIYILPTGLGFGFGVMLFAMLLGSMNYNNSMGFALTFLLASLALVAMHHCHRNLNGLVVRSAGAEPVFAGQDARFTIALENQAAGPRLCLRVTLHGEIHDTADLDTGGQCRMTMSVPTSGRGYVRIDRFGIETTFPLTLFRAWTWIHMDLGCVVYPAPADRGLPPPPRHTDTGGAQDDSAGDDDFAGLRTYRPGDSPRHIAWKAFAREQELLVKQYAGTDVTTHWFEWDSLPMSDLESRLAQLCRWIVDAHGDGHAFGLRLPAAAIEPNLGISHRRRCLTALALFDITDKPRAIDA